MFWLPTHAAWHGFHVPDGSPYRQAFVVCGWLTVMGWITISHKSPDAPAWIGGCWH